MKDSILLHMLDSRNNLFQVVPCFKFSQAMSPSHQLRKSLVLTQLQQDVYILFVFKEVLKFYNVRVDHLLMNLDFPHDLLLLPCLL